jgi:hypothetical protein
MIHGVFYASDLSPSASEVMARPLSARSRWQGVSRRSIASREGAPKGSIFRASLVNVEPGSVLTEVENSLEIPPECGGDFLVMMDF